MENDEVARKIINYLRKHPDAGDTLEGIAKWWLQSECIEQSLEKVSAALQQLVKKGMIKKQKAKYGNVFFYKSL